MDLIKRLFPESFLDFLASMPRVREEILFFGRSLNYRRYIGFRLVGGVNVFIHGLHEFFLLLSLILQDVLCSRGFILISNANDVYKVDKFILSCIPEGRINDIVYNDLLMRTSADVFRLGLSRLVEERRIIIIKLAPGMNTDQLLERICSELSGVVSKEPFRIYVCRTSTPSIDAVLKVKDHGISLIFVPAPSPFLEQMSGKIAQFIGAFDMVALTGFPTLLSEIKNALVNIPSSLYAINIIKNARKERTVIFSLLERWFKELRPIFRIPRILTPQTLCYDECLEESGVLNRERINNIVVHSLSRWGAAGLMPAPLLKETEEYKILKEYVDQGYGVTVKTIGGRNYLYVQKRVRNKIITKSLGPINQSMIDALGAFPEIAERLKDKLNMPAGS